MAEAEIIEALAECLEALRRGGADLEACLERYPGRRTELEALLEVVRLIPQLPDQISPSPHFRARTRRRLRGRPDGNPSLPSDPGWQSAGPA